MISVHGANPIFSKNIKIGRPTRNPLRPITSLFCLAITCWCFKSLYKKLQLKTKEFVGFERKEVIKNVIEKKNDLGILWGKTCVFSLLYCPIHRNAYCKIIQVIVLTTNRQKYFQYPFTYTIFINENLFLLQKYWKINSSY